MEFTNIKNWKKEIVKKFRAIKLLENPPSIVRSDL